MSGVINADQMFEMKWSKRNKEYYESKGYVFTKKDDSFVVTVEDLMPSSRILVDAKCDCCDNSFSKPYRVMSKSSRQFCDVKCMNNYVKKNGSFNNTQLDYKCGMCDVDIKVKQYIMKELEDGKRNNIFCSVKCNTDWQSINRTGENHHSYNQIKKNCNYCDEEYTVKNYRDETSKYCSEDCRRDGSRTGTYLKCLNCDEYTYKTDSDIKKNKSGQLFCSHDCSNTYKIKEHREIRSCVICDDPFEARTSSTQTLCSIECQGEWQSLNLIGINANNFNKELSIKDRMIKCDWCEEEYEIRSPYRLRLKTEQGKFLFCSASCRQTWYAQEWSQSDSWREESKIRAVNMLEQGVFNTDSNIQMITNSILNDLSVEFVNEFNAKYVSIDNYLSKYNLMIEVMGQYWHTDPRKYSEINYQMQVDRIKNDKIKKSYIKSQYDIDILYLWEEDILTNPMMIKQLIQEYINKQGQLENYHSFNYSFDNLLSINKNLIVTYMEYSIECLRPIINIESSS